MVVLDEPLLVDKLETFKDLSQLVLGKPDRKKDKRVSEYLESKSLCQRLPSKFLVEFLGLL